MKSQKLKHFLNKAKSASHDKLLLARDYATTQKWWIMVFFAILILDGITTQIALRNNLSESNPVWANAVLLTSYPWIANIVRILGGIAVVFLVGAMSNSRWYKWWFLQAYTIGYGIVPIWNISNVIWVWLKNITPKYREPFEFWQMWLLALGLFSFGCVALYAYRKFYKRRISEYL